MNDKKHHMAAAAADPRFCGLNDNVFFSEPSAGTSAFDADMIFKRGVIVWRSQIAAAANCTFH